MKITLANKLKPSYHRAKTPTVEANRQASKILKARDIGQPIDHLAIGNFFKRKRPSCP